MGCEEFRESLSAFADREVDPAERERISAHLARCPECRARLDRIQRLRAAVREAVGVEAPAPEPSADFFDRLDARMRAEIEGGAGVRPAPTGEFPWATVVRYAAAVLLAVSCGTIAYRFIHPGGSGGTPPAVEPVPAGPGGLPGPPPPGAGGSEAPPVAIVAQEGLLRRIADDIDFAERRGARALRPAE